MASVQPLVRELVLFPVGIANHLEKRVNRFESLQRDPMVRNRLFFLGLFGLSSANFNHPHLQFTVHSWFSGLCLDFAEPSIISGFSLPF